MYIATTNIAIFGLNICAYDIQITADIHIKLFSLNTRCLVSFA